MRITTWMTWTAALGTALLGCGVETGDVSGKGQRRSLEPGLALPAAYAGDTPLPAYQTEAELANAGKADALVVNRTYEELFAPTAAPQNVRAVAEWEHVDSIIVHWDPSLEGFYREMVDALYRVSNVHLLTKDVAESDAAKAKLASLGMDTSKIKFFEYPNDSIWTRDFGPITVEKADGQPAFVDLHYYPNRVRDNAVPTLMADYYAVDVFRPGIQAEGGNFMSNGGEVCVFSDVIPVRNNLPTQTVVDAYKSYFGCQQVVVAEHLAREGTGHVDMWTKFAQEDVVLVGAFDPAVDPDNAARLDRNAARLAALTLADGRQMKVIRIPMPAQRVAGGYETVLTYTNSLVVNQTVVIPRFSDRKELEAEVLAAYKAAFPAGTKFKWVDSDDVIEWGGAVHCTTMSYSVGPIPDFGAVTPPTTAESLFQLNPVLPVADNEETTSSMDVPGTLTGTVDEVIVDVTIEHTFVGDLVIALEHDGRSEVLFQGDGAGQNLRESFRTNAFAGLPQSGEWTLTVTDTAREDEGTLYAWTLGFAK